MNPIAQMDIDLLVALDALLQDRNITRAAVRLGISQPALSARLTRLRIWPVPIGQVSKPAIVANYSGRGPTAIYLRGGKASAREKDRLAVLSMGCVVTAGWTRVA